MGHHGEEGVEVEAEVGAEAEEVGSYFIVCHFFIFQSRSRFLSIALEVKFLVEVGVCCGDSELHVRFVNGVFAEAVWACFHVGSLYGRQRHGKLRL